jgi:hypothetical protein
MPVTASIQTNVPLTSCLGGATAMSPNGRAAVPPTSRPPPEATCPWCAYVGSLKRAMEHMQFEHHRQWCDLALFPPIAGGVW